MRHSGRRLDLRGTSQVGSAAGALARLRSRGAKTGTGGNRALAGGVDSAVDLNKAKLGAARVRLHQAEARGRRRSSPPSLNPDRLAGVFHRTGARDHSGLALGRSARRSFGKGGCLQPRPQIRGTTFPGRVDARRGRASLALADHRLLRAVRTFPPSITMPSTSQGHVSTGQRHHRPGLRIPLFNASQRAAPTRPRPKP